MGTTTLSAQDLFPNIPSTLRDELLAAYQEIVKNFRENRWEPAELNGGKISEVVYTILKGYIDGSYPSKATKPNNMVDACRALEQTPDSLATQPIKIQIPRMLVALYDIRNKRGVGHVGGDVNPNHMDATCVLYIAKWILSELIRIFHGVKTEEATEIVEGIIERSIPLIWTVGDKKRILDIKMKMKEKTLLLLYSSSNPLVETELHDWVEHSDISNYRRDVLRPLHKQKLVEYDSDSGRVTISPKGQDFVERRLL